jgi:hypothetical protein
MVLQSLLPAIVNRFRPLPETSHALDLCQSHEADPHLNSRMTRPISSNRRKCRVRILNAMVAGFFGFYVLRLKPEGFMGKTDV